MTTVDTEPRWHDLMSTWDAQQTGYLPRREERFTAIVRTLGAVLGGRFTVVDLGCGPGSLSRRILDTYPEATAVAVDADPLLLRLGRNALIGYGERLRWVDADLRDPSWTERLGVERVDAAVSTTALHWLDPGALFTLYQRVGRLVRPGGVLLNGDNMPYDPGQAIHERLANEANERAAHEAFTVAGVPDWDRWWTQAADALADEARERQERRARADERYGLRDGDRLTSLSTHVTALTEAGFREIATIWQDLDDRVLLAVR
ncbi:class I SAM-dependent methyltransferase [Dactylosporangium sp. NPDC005572]|uniref:class I SAM-dependent methyltransferase n=1 Tax=Dactylosporangium sp. NPDC005572 TaxID=3156889 RepID=UPI0033A7F112